jgi:hypothetical protein
VVVNDVDLGNRGYGYGYAYAYGEGSKKSSVFKSFFKKRT